MKANWKFALMGLAALAFIACDPNKPNNPDNPGNPDDPGEYVNPISVTDNSIADWSKLDQNYVFEAVCPEDASYLGLKRIKVYADEYYISMIAEYDPEEIPEHGQVPFHIYFNTDNSDETGGYGDQWLDANVDIMMEGFFFSAASFDADDNPLDPGSPVAYEPVIVPWTGEVGGTGWGWGDELVPSAPCVASQHVEGNMVEMQFIRELVPTLVGWNETEFGVGCDIQQHWESVGILPLNSPDAEGSDATGHAHKLQVRIKK